MSYRNNQSYPYLQTNVYQNPAVTEPILDYEFEEGYVSAYSKKLNDEIVRLRKRRYLSNPLSGSRTMAGLLESIAFGVDQADHNWLLQNKSQKEDPYFWLKGIGIVLLILLAIFLLVNLP